MQRQRPNITDTCRSGRKKCTSVIRTHATNTTKASAVPVPACRFHHSRTGAKGRPKFTFNPKADSNRLRSRARGCACIPQQPGRSQFRTTNPTVQSASLHAFRCSTNTPANSAVQIKQPPPRLRLPQRGYSHHADAVRSCSKLASEKSTNAAPHRTIPRRFKPNATIRQCSTRTRTKKRMRGGKAPGGRQALRK